MELDKVFRALGDKHRLQIMDLLREGEMNAGELLERVDVVQSTLSHHMKSLCESGLVTARKEKKWTYYSLAPSAAEEARAYLKRYLGGNVFEKREELPTIYASMKPSKKKKDEKEKGKKSTEKKKSGGKKKQKEKENGKSKRN